jgi:hypothetical protein
MRHAGLVPVAGSLVILTPNGSRALAGLTESSSARQMLADALPAFAALTFKVAVLSVDPAAPCL